MYTGTFALAALLTVDGPFFPASLVPSHPRADTRRCVVGAQATQSDCALIAPQWVATTAGAVSQARPVGGKLHVRIGDESFVVDQVVYHPRWAGGAKFDVTLMRLVARVPAFPLLPPPGEFPVHVERVAQHAFAHRTWVATVIGPSTRWDAHPPAPTPTQSTIVARVRSIMDGLTGRTSND